MWRIEMRKGWCWLLAVFCCCVSAALASVEAAEEPFEHLGKSIDGSIVYKKPKAFCKDVFYNGFMPVSLHPDEDVFICKRLQGKNLYAISYDQSKRVPDYVAYRAKYITSNVARESSEPFYEDPGLEANEVEQAKDSDYAGQSQLFDRGHLLPAKLFSHSYETFSATFSLTNVVPQTSKVNQQLWKYSEFSFRAYLSDPAHRSRTMHFITGSFFEEPKKGKKQAPLRWLKNRVQVPDGVYSVMYDPVGRIGFGFYASNRGDAQVTQKCKSRKTDCLVPLSISDIETRIGNRELFQLPDSRKQLTAEQKHMLNDYIVSSESFEAVDAPSEDPSVKKKGYVYRKHKQGLFFFRKTVWKEYYLVLLSESSGNAQVKWFKDRDSFANGAKAEGSLQINCAKLEDLSAEFQQTVAVDDETFINRRGKKVPSSLFLSSYFFALSDAAKQPTIKYFSVDNAQSRTRWAEVLRKACGIDTTKKGKVPVKAKGIALKGKLKPKLVVAFPKGAAKQPVKGKAVKSKKKKTTVVVVDEEDSEVEEDETTEDEEEEEEEE